MARPRHTRLATGIYWFYQKLLVLPKKWLPLTLTGFNNVRAYHRSKLTVFGGGHEVLYPWNLGCHGDHNLRQQPQLYPEWTVVLVAVTVITYFHMFPWLQKDWRLPWLPLKPASGFYNFNQFQPAATTLCESNVAMGTISPKSSMIFQPTASIHNGFPYFPCFSTFPCDFPVNFPLPRQEQCGGQEVNVPDTATVAMECYGTVTGEVRHHRSCSSRTFYVDLDWGADKIFVQERLMSIQEKLSSQDRHKRTCCCWSGACKILRPGLPKTSNILQQELSHKHL